MEVAEPSTGAGTVKNSTAMSESSHEVSVEKTATGLIEQETSLQRSVEQSVEKSVQQQSSSQLVQKSVQSSSVSVSSSTVQRKVATSSLQSTVRIGQSTEIEEIDF